jgi:hypothetical protein
MFKKIKICCNKILMKLNIILQILDKPPKLVVSEEGFGPPTRWFIGTYFNPLSYRICLHPQDIFPIIDNLINIKFGVGPLDKIYNFKNCCIRSVANLL